MENGKMDTPNITVEECIDVICSYMECENFAQVLFVTDTLQEKIKTVAQRRLFNQLIEKITQDAHDTQAWLKSSGRIGRRKR